MPFLSDVRYAARVLARSPLFTATSVLSLAIGVAASTAIFSLADAMLLRPRSGVADPASLVDIGRSVRGEGFDNFGYPLFAALRDRNTTLQAMSAAELGPTVMSLGDASGSERVFATLVSGNFFEVVGVGPAAGRFFLPDEDRTPGTHPVVVLSHGFWEQRLKADPGVVGTTLRLNGLPYTVVGVAAKDFTGTSLLGTDFWVPMAMDRHVRASDTSLLTDVNASWHMAIGRLKPGVTLDQARAELNAILKAYFTDLGNERAERWGIAIARSSRIPAPMQAPVVGFIGVLGALTGLVLIIACSNIAGMLLARALERRREVATRLAIGASRSRIVAQLLVEGLTLAILSAAVSVPLVMGMVGLLAAFQPDIPIPIALDLRVDLRVLGFGIGLGMLTTVLFALLPALQATRVEIAPALHGSTATADRRRAWLRQALVGGQIAMALLLMVAAGLFLRSLAAAGSIDSGFNAENVDTVQIDVRLGGYQTDADGVRVISELIERFGRVPGVTAVGASRMVPLQGGGLGLGGLRAPGYVGPDGTNEVNSDWDVVSPRYFEALEMPIVRGRAFTDADRAGSAWVAIINEHMAAQLWPGRDPIGQQLIQEMGQKTERPLQIVGVAKTAKYRSIGEAPQNFIYVPYAQQFMSDMTFYVRRQPGASQIASMRQMLIDYDAGLPLLYAQTLEQATAIGLLPQRLAAWIAGTVGSVGLLLAALGLYGLTAFSVAQRTREIALRMALGASSESVLMMILRQSGRLAVVGGLIGVALAIGVSLLLQSLLIGIAPIDPLAFANAILLLALVLAAAAWGPARRAARMDPMRALRAE
jgi:putative ABC transport system permease protein